MDLHDCLLLPAYMAGGWRNKENSEENPQNQITTTMEKKFYFIRGNAEHPERVKAALEKRGAKKGYYTDFDFPENIYFIDPYNKINWTDEGSTLGLMLQEYGEEIFPEPEYKYNVGDVVIYDGEKVVVNGLYNDNGSPAYCLFGHSDPVGEYLIFPVSEPELEPEPQFQPFQKVLVRDSDCDRWQADLYGFRNTGAVCSHACVGSAWSYCIPYEGNERLLGTTDKP